MDRKVFPEVVWESAKIRTLSTETLYSENMFVINELKHSEEESAKIYRMDVIWGHLNNMMCIDGSRRFPLLFAIARLALILLYSNDSEERIFSMIRKNKTPFRASLAFDGTRSSIITTKLANSEQVTRLNHLKNF